MKPSQLQLIDTLDGLLLQLPDLVRRFERRDTDAERLLLEWIDRAEVQLSTHRMTEAARLAAAKARILAAARERGRGTRARRSHVALDTMHELQDCLHAASAPRRQKLDQARELARQLIQIVAQTGAVKYQIKSGFDGLIAQVWALCNSHAQLKPGAMQLKTLLSAEDIRLLLAQELSPADFAG